MASRRFFEEAPGRVAVARDVEGRLCGYQVSVTPANAPSFADDHPLLGPWLQDARRRAPGLEAILWSESVDFTRDPTARVQAMLGMAGILRSGLENPRFAYAPINPRLSGALAFCAALGARHLSALDAEIGGTELQCHLIDYGEGGLLGTQHRAVYAELGLPVPRPSSPPQLSVADEVRKGLRNLGVPHKLAASGLARGDSSEERAASVRELIEHASEHAFGETEDERLLHRVLVRGYLEPAMSHEVAADELHLSRSAYFRRLKAASEQLAAWVERDAAGRSAERD